MAHSLAQVNSDGVEIIVQTMPPFPWHFGGQSFPNLFVDLRIKSLKNLDIGFVDTSFYDGCQSF